MLKILTLNEAGKWDELVRSMPRHDVYWLSGYVKAFEIHGDGEPLLFYGEAGGVRGINVVLRRDVARDVHFQGKIPAGTFYDFSTPYGYGGWLTEGGDAAGLLLEYQAWTREQGIVSEFVRFHPMLKNHEGLEGFYAVRQLGEVVHMALESPEAIWQNLSSKNRNMIRKAQKRSTTKPCGGTRPRRTTTLKTPFTIPSGRIFRGAHICFAPKRTGRPSLRPSC